MHIKSKVMTSNEILKADVLDILFDNRNKQYGAYTLRKSYNSRLATALAISLSSFVLVFFLTRLDHSITVSQPIIDDDILVRLVEIPKEPKKLILPPAKKIPAQQFRRQQFTRMVIVNKKTVIPPPDIRSLETSGISDKTVDGPFLKIATPIINEAVVMDLKEDRKTSSNETLIQREPEFPGGQTAWLNFLKKNLIVPEQLEPGDKKMVSIRFQVSVEGVVTDFEIIQSAGKVFDNEVIRVLKKMPRWKPAIEKGQPVTRAFSQPVTFVGIEQ
jgi:periplasmic protein TonB